ncbi:MAG: PAS domain S-box protein, partial [Acidimicrobiia bacterium]|nr:PAS domain S-box protein [Acidimicrobiia bacterium]
MTAPESDAHQSAINELQATIAELESQRDSARASVESKSEFIAHISHELRTPMNGIIGMTQLALDANPNPEQQEYLGVVLSSADSLLTLLNDLLDHAKIESGKLQ